MNKKYQLDLVLPICEVCFLSPHNKNVAFLLFDEFLSNKNFIAKQKQQKKKIDMRFFNCFLFFFFFLDGFVLVTGGIVLGVILSSIEVSYGRRKIAKM